MGGFQSHALIHAYFYHAIIKIADISQKRIYLSLRVINFFFQMHCKVKFHRKLYIAYSSFLVIKITVEKFINTSVIFVGILIRAKITLNVFHDITITSDDNILLIISIQFINLFRSRITLVYIRAKKYTQI